MDDKISLIIVEDHALTRIGLKTAFEESANIKVIGEAQCGETGIKLALDLVPDIVIMDLGLPNINGIDATKKIKELNSSIKVMILTSHDNAIEVIGAIGAGADAYCMKDVSPARLISIIGSIAGGGVWLDPAVAKIVLGNVMLNNKANRNICDEKGEFSPLTEREIEVLQHLADGLNNIGIGQKLLVSQHTVKAHICNILQKLAVDDRTQAVARAMRKGWIK